MSEDHILSFDLGSHVFAVSTKSDMAQRLFDQGLNWCFGFNQEEGLACFKKALDSDPQCAMLHWGVAYAAGPFYNMPWCDFSEPEAIDCTAFCRGHIDQALALLSRATTLEAALIRALALRVQKSHPVSQCEYDSWDDAYADAMRKVYVSFPEHQDVAALFVEAMMSRTPWRMWDVKTGLVSAGADTHEAITVCEKAIALADANDEQQHPAILHLHIHLLEMSPTPERAMDSADRLGGYRLMQGISTICLGISMFCVANMKRPGLRVKRLSVSIANILPTLDLITITQQQGVTICIYTPALP